MCSYEYLKDVLAEEIKIQLFQTYKEALEKIYNAKAVEFEFDNEALASYRWKIAAKALGKL